MSAPRPTEPAAQTPTDGRPSNGRFAKGNPGAPGNPFARQVAALRQVILGSITEEMAELVRHPEKYDNPFCFEAVLQALKDSDTSEAARQVWAPPSPNGLFGSLPPRIRQLAQALFDLDAPSPNGESPS